jgi:hypothetical protein
VVVAASVMLVVVVAVVEEEVVVTTAVPGAAVVVAVPAVPPQATRSRPIRTVLVRTRPTLTPVPVMCTWSGSPIGRNMVATGM